MEGGAEIGFAVSWRLKKCIKWGFWGKQCQPTPTSHRCHQFADLGTRHGSPLVLQVLQVLCIHCVVEWTYSLHRSKTGRQKHIHYYATLISRSLLCSCPQLTDRTHQIDHPQYDKGQIHSPEINSPIKFGYVGYLYLKR